MKTNSEISDIIDIAKVFNPKLMAKARIFIKDDAISGVNEFFEITISVFMRMILLYQKELL